MTRDTEKLTYINNEIAITYCDRNWLEKNKMKFKKKQQNLKKKNTKFWEEE